VRRKTVINLVTGVGLLGFSILAGWELHSPIAALVTAFSIAILRLLVDIRLNLHTNIPVEVSFLNSYTKLRESQCELFREAAAVKLRSVTAYFDDLAAGHLPVENQSEVFDLLKLLFCDIDLVRQIRTTSFGETDEWRNWWGKRYLDIHKKAKKRGVKVHRVFILHSDDDVKAGADIMRANATEGVAVKYVLRRVISQGDFNTGNNCMLFYDRNGVPVYALQAEHDGNGGFLGAVIHNDTAHMKLVVDAYSHIDALAVEFR
jgi:hypothetical protein